MICVIFERHFFLKCHFCHFDIDWSVIFERLYRMKWRRRRLLNVCQIIQQLILYGCINGDVVNVSYISPEYFLNRKLLLIQSWASKEKVWQIKQCRNEAFLECSIYIGIMKKGSGIVNYLNTSFLSKNHFQENRKNIRALWCYYLYLHSWVIVGVVLNYNPCGVSH